MATSSSFLDSLSPKIFLEQEPEFWKTSFSFCINSTSQENRCFRSSVWSSNPHLRYLLFRIIHLPCLSAQREIDPARQVWLRDSAKDWLLILAVATCQRDLGEVCLAPKKEKPEERDLSLSLVAASGYGAGSPVAGLLSTKGRRIPETPEPWAATFEAFPTSGLLATWKN